MRKDLKIQNKAALLLLLIKIFAVFSSLVMGALSAVAASFLSSDAGFFGAPHSAQENNVGTILFAYAAVLIVGPWFLFKRHHNTVFITLIVSTVIATISLGMLEGALDALGVTVPYLVFIIGLYLLHRLVEKKMKKDKS